MSALSVVSSTSSEQIAVDNNVTHNLPSGLVAGNKLVIVFAYNEHTGTDEIPIYNLSDGIKILDGPVTNGFADAYVLGKTLDGTEGSTYTMDLVRQHNSVSIAFQVSADFDLTLVESTYETSSGTTASPNPPSHTSSYGTLEHLWIAAVFHTATGTVTGYPSGYSGGAQQDTGGSNGTTAGAAYKISSGSSEDPGAFTLSTARTVGQWTIAVPARSKNVRARLAKYRTLGEARR